MVSAQQVPWVKVPAEGLTSLLRALAWTKRNGGSAAQDVAALMIYIVLLYRRGLREKNRELLEHQAPEVENIAVASYDEIGDWTGLSRSLINQGLERLIELQVIRAEGSNQKRVYVLAWPAGRWFKLPCRAVFTASGIPAFKSFTLRSKHELNALKLYLYLADVRDRASAFSQASYETIRARIGIQERDIPRAINVLNTAHLVVRSSAAEPAEGKQHGANAYYLAGYRDLVRPSAASAASNL